MDSHKRLILLVCTCLVVVGISAAVRIQHELTPPGEKGIFAGLLSDESPHLDPSFVDERMASSSSTQGSGIPGLTAKAYLVGDIGENLIVMQYNSSKTLPVASMSKLVTAFVATDMMHATTTIVIASSTHTAPPETSNLHVDEQIKKRNK